MVMFSIKMLWLMAVGVAFLFALASVYFAALHLHSGFGTVEWLGFWMIFLLLSSAVGLSLWAVWAKYAKVSGQFLFLRVFGVMGVGAVFFWATINFFIIVSHSSYPEKINEPVLRGFLFLASIVGASLGVIFSVYRQRFGDSL